MPFDAYLWIDGVKGETTATGLPNPDSIDIISYSFGASNPSTYCRTRARGSDRANRPAIREWTSSRPCAHAATSATLRSSTTPER